MPDIPFNRHKACRYGEMIYNINDIYVGRSFDLYGEFSEAEVDLFRQIIKPQQIVVDIGANIGAHTVFFARAVGPTGAVLAFEPQRVVFQTLCGNMAINSLTNVRCYDAALGAEPGEIVVPPYDYSREANFGGVSLGTHATGETVDVLTFDELSLPACHFIKIDVEGMELEVLKGCVDTVRRLHPTLYVENDRPEKSADLIRFIDSLGYHMYWHKTRLFNPNNFFNNPNNVFENTGSANMLCLPKDASVDIDLPPVEVPTATTNFTN